MLCKPAGLANQLAVPFLMKHGLQFSTEMYLSLHMLCKAFVILIALMMGCSFHGVDSLDCCGVQAFLAASLKTDEDLLGWFNERLVWNDQGVVTEMLKNGLFVRIFAPQVPFLSNTFEMLDNLEDKDGTQVQK